MIPPIGVKIFGWDTLSPKLAQIQRRLKSFGSSANTIGRTMTAGFSLPFALAGGASLKMSTDFNAAMANVGALIPGNIKRLQQLKKQVQDLSVETGLSPKVLAQGLFQVISALGDSEDTFARLRVNARGSVAGISEVADAVVLTTMVTKNYGNISEVATQKVLDLAFKANELGVTTFPEMATSMGAVIPFANKLGVAQEELFGVMGTFTGVAGNTSEVVTQLRSFLGALLKPTADMSIAFRMLGVRSGEELIKTRGLQGAMDALVKITKPYPGILGKVLGRKEALNIVLAASGNLSAKFTENVGKMYKALGSSEKAFKEQTEGINKAGFAFRQFQQRLTVLAQKFGDAFAPLLMRILNKLSPFVKKLTDLSDTTQKWIFVIGSFIGIVGPLLLALGAVAVAVAAISWPVVLVTAGIVGLIAGISALIYWWDEVITFTSKWGWALSFIMGPIGIIIWLASLLIKHWDKFVGVLKDVYAWIEKVINKISDSKFGQFVANMDNVLASFETPDQSRINEMYYGAMTQPKPKAQINVNIPKAPPGTEVSVESEDIDTSIEQGLIYEY